MVDTVSGMEYLLSGGEASRMLLTVAAVLVGGLLGQAIARRLRIPAIVPLLVIGVVVGRDLLGWIDPRLFGAGQRVLVGFAVAVILFEGGLSLKRDVFQYSGVAIRRLVTVGALITWGLATAVAAMLVPDLGWGPAALFGALIIVTGPTVILPLLNAIQPRRRVADILRGEAILIDPVGAFLAVLTHEYLLATVEGDAAGSPVVGFLERVGIGLGLGIAGALVLDFVLRRLDTSAPELKNRAALVGAVSVYAASEHLQPESGVLAATLAGLVLGWRHPPGIEEVEEFKGHVVGILVSMVFILLAADLELANLVALGWPGFFVVVAVILVVRPASVFLSTWGAGLGLRERLFLSWIAPRGIVAAAVSSLFAIELAEREELRDAGRLVMALTFAVIAGTVLVQGPSARFVGRWLRVLDTGPVGFLLVGGNAVARALGRALHGAGHRVLLLDTNLGEVRRAREAGLPARRANVLDDEATSSLDLDGMSALLALTPNDRVNRLAIRLHQPSFGRARTRAIRTSESSAPRPGAPPWLAGDRLSFEDLQAALKGGARIETARIDEEASLKDLEEHLPGPALLAIDMSGAPRFLDDATRVRPNDVLFYLDRDGDPSQLRRS